MRRELSEEESSAVEHLRACIGSRLDDHDPTRTIWGQYPYYTEISRDAAHHYALGVDDLNPLWVRPQYGPTSAVGAHVAPPSLVFPLGPGGLSGSMFAGLPAGFGTHETWGGAELSWHDWMRVGTPVEVTSTLVGVDVVAARSGPLVKLTAETVFQDATTDQPLATVRSWVFRKRAGAYGARFADRTSREWSAEEIAGLRTSQQERVRRGAQPRPLASVAEGDTFALAKGPLTLGANVSFLAAWQGQIGGRGDIPWELESQFPAGRLGLPQEQHVAGHYDVDKATSMGLPGTYDCGPQRTSWAVQLMTDWIGDAGFLDELRFEVRDFNFVGDLQTLTATVTEVRPQDERRNVRCSIECHNQDGHLTGRGTSTATLPVHPVASSRAGRR